jgi:prepilin-type N-terminal cleavage/methylation domain-containing protein
MGRIGGHVLWGSVLADSPLQWRSGQLFAPLSKHRYRRLLLRRGFTMPEVLVVIALLAILLSLLIPVIGRVRAQARFAMCKKNLQTLVQAHQLYGSNFNDAKPPLWRFGSMSDYFDCVSPDIKKSNTPVGNGLLVQLKYIPLAVLLDPSEGMAQDVARDEKNWSSAPNSGSSYVYFYTSPPYPPLKKGESPRAKYTKGAKPAAMLMDLNTEAQHPYVGEYSGRAWVSHPTVKKMNVAYSDGAVIDFPIEQLQLKSPGGPFEEIQWFNAANDARR